MPRYIAFLRAINVGGRHVVTMDRLRTLFEALGFSAVETFIASGNVVFESKARDARALERKIERRLHEALGFEVATFLRTAEELAAIAAYEPFAPAALARAVALNVLFLRDALDDRGKRALMALRTELDDFHVDGREIHWLCRVTQGESTISNVVLQKALGREATARGANTIRKMAAKFGRAP